MTLRIGNRGFTQPFFHGYEKFVGRAGFTLIEVMVTTAILSLGIVMVYKSFFNLLDTYNYCADYLSVQPMIDEKLWQAKDDLELYGKLTDIETQGVFRNRNRDFSWNLTSDLIDGSRKFYLYRINLAFSWFESFRHVSINRFTYALFKKS